MLAKFQAIREILLAFELHVGVMWGSLAAVAASSVAWLPRVASRRPFPFAGAALVVACLAALHQTRGIPLSLAGGVAALALAGGAIAVLRLPWLSWPLLFAPGAALVIGGLPQASGPVWFKPLAFGAIVLGGSLATDFARADRDRALGPALALCTAAGVFITVPDTEEALVLLGATLPLAATGWPLRWASLGLTGTAAWVALVVWTSIAGGMTRPTSIVGGVACLGVLVLEPVARAITSARAAPPPAEGPAVSERPRPRLRAIVALGATHAAYVLVASRVAGFQRSAAAAAVVLAVATGAALWMLVRENRGP